MDLSQQTTKDAVNRENYEYKYEVGNENDVDTFNIPYNGEMSNRELSTYTGPISGIFIKTLMEKYGRK